MTAPDDTDDRFDWSDESVVIREQSAIAVYLNRHGDVVLRRQAHPFFEDGDVTVVIAAREVSRLANAMLDLIGREASSEIEAPPTAPETNSSQNANSNAERQRRYRERKRNETTVTASE